MNNNISGILIGILLTVSVFLFIGATNETQKKWTVHNGHVIAGGSVAMQCTYFIDNTTGEVNLALSQGIKGRNLVPFTVKEK